MKRAVMLGVILALCLLVLFGAREKKGLGSAAQCLVGFLQESEACAAWFGLEERGEWA